MRQLYIKKKQYRARRSFYTGLCCLNRSICANCLIFDFLLLQNAELLYSSEKLFLIRSAVSGLTVILPNMDRMAGGELE